MYRSFGNRSRLAGASLVASALAYICYPCPALAVISTPSTDMPGPLSAEESRQAIQLRDGFAVELVASEPLVQDPVAIDWGADGRLWVVEMADYPAGVDKTIDAPGRADAIWNTAPGGRVRVLEDTDDDGRYDKSTIFLDGIPFPSGIMVWRDGILLSAAPDLIYAEDTDGDGKADMRRTLYHGFATGNPQHQVNGFCWGLDNWVYLANGDNGGSVTSKLTGETVDLGGRDLRIRPDTGEMDPQTGQSQYGRNRDDWGNWFGSNNSEPLIHFVLDDHRLRRNPFATAPSSRITIASAENTEIFPIGSVMSHWAGYRPPAPGTPHRFGSSCSASFYRDDLLGPDYCGNAFICEPAHNLLHRRIVVPRGLTFTSHRAVGEEKREFLASTDPWFRPTSWRTGPDGALWVVDMYRQVIEHPDFIDVRARESLDLRAGNDRGRIYRVYPVGRGPRPMPRLDRLDAEGLVAALESSNGWQRDRAQQMLIWRGERTVATLLTSMSLQSQDPHVRLHALCTLDGLGALTSQTLAAPLSDPHPGVRRHAVRLVESATNASEETLRLLRNRIEDDDLQVRLQCAYALGQQSDAASAKALGKMAVACTSEPHLFAAVLSSVNRTNLDWVLAEVFRSHAARGSLRGLLRQLLQVATSLGDESALVRVLGIVGAASGDSYEDWQFSALSDVLEAWQRRGKAFGGVSSTSAPEINSALQSVDRVFEAARTVAVDPNADLNRRTLAVALLGRGRAARPGDLDLLAQLLTPQTPGELQSAVVESLGKLDDPGVPDVLVRHWKEHGPKLRQSVIDVLLSRSQWRLSLLASLEQGVIGISDFDAAQRRLLLRDGNAEIKERAERIVTAASSLQERPQLEETMQVVFELRGNPTHGEVVFKNKCSSCHRIEGVGHAVGPDLSTLVSQSRDSLLTSILDPNRAVDPKYRTYVAATREGRQYAGLLGNETSQSVTLVGAEGKRQTVLRADLESLTDLGKSFMPEGMEQDLSHQDLSDIVAYAERIATGQFSDDERVPIDAELDGAFALTANEARAHGNRLVLRHQSQSLVGWSEAGDVAVWSLRVVESGAYAVLIDYAMEDATGQSRCEIDVEGMSIAGPATSTGAADVYRQTWLGHLVLASGERSLTLRATLTDRASDFSLRQIWLVPMSDAEAAMRSIRPDGNAPRLVQPDGAGGFQLAASDCEIRGEGLSLENRSPSRLAFWSRGESRAVWTLHVEKPGDYFVFVDYACGRAAGARYVVSSGDAESTRPILGSGSWQNDRQQFAGTLSLKAGMRRLTFRCVGQSDDCLIDLREISLVPEATAE